MMRTTTKSFRKCNVFLACVREVLYVKIQSVEVALPNCIGFTFSSKGDLKNF